MDCKKSLAFSAAAAATGAAGGGGGGERGQIRTGLTCKAASSASASAAFEIQTKKCRGDGITFAKEQISQKNVPK